MLFLIEGTTSKLEFGAGHPQHVPDLGDHGAGRQHAVGMRRPVERGRRRFRRPGRACPGADLVGPAPEAWAAGGGQLVLALVVGVAAMASAMVLNRHATGRVRGLSIIAVLIGGFFLYRYLFDPAVEAIEKMDPSTGGNIGGLGLPVLLSWPVGGVLAAGAAWLIAQSRPWRQ